LRELVGGGDTERATGSFVVSLRTACAAPLQHTKHGGIGGRHVGCSARLSQENRA
jgi:hypothetical protein